jgi:hypothetical protein
MKGEPLTGCDAYFLAIEELMRRGGQGCHTGLTVLVLDGEVDAGALRAAGVEFARRHGMWAAEPRRAWWLGEPRWVRRGGGGGVPVHEAGEVGPLDDFCHRLLGGAMEVPLELHVVRCDAGVVVVARWSHGKFDGRGVELALAELAGGVVGDGAGGAADRPRGGLVEQFRATRAFVRRWCGMRPARFRSMGRRGAAAGAARFRVRMFDEAETRRIEEGVVRWTGGIFRMPYFFAVVARAHAAVWRVRGGGPGVYESPVPVQARRRADRGPVFQNRVTVLFFQLEEERMGTLGEAVAAVQEQFEEVVRTGVDRSAAVMMWWMRRLPPRWYLEFLRWESGGELASFFQSHTGGLLRGVERFGGAGIVNGWHVPAVSHPPGSGIFFSERGGRLAATISWREGVVSDGEVDVMEAALCADLLG